jgi:mono/diheme cytochrome c family protein
MTGKAKLGLAAAVVIAAAVAGLSAILTRGVTARPKPWAIEAFLARRLRHLAVPRGAREVRNPLPETPDALSRGLEHFADHCASCHANDGSGDTSIGKSFYPPVPDMRAAQTQELSDGELFYIIENGVRFTGMPAWGTEAPEDDENTWTLVHFIRHLKDLTPAELEEMESLNPKSPKALQEEEEIRRFLAGEDVPQPHKH